MWPNITMIFHADGTITSNVAEILKKNLETEEDAPSHVKLAMGVEILLKNEQAKILNWLDQGVERYQHYQSLAGNGETQ